MFNTGSRIGALTNAEDWIVFQRPGDDANGRNDHHDDNDDNDDNEDNDDNDDIDNSAKEIIATRVSGATGGKSNALNILLAMTLSA